MAFSTKEPVSFRDALLLAKKILSSNLDLVRNNLLETEAEQIVTAAYRMATGKSLSRIELFSRVTDRFPEAAGTKVNILSHARAEGKPLQHLTGYQIFLHHEYEVGKAVLVPRPETEILVSIALSKLRALPQKPTLGIEIGIGSGAISVELLSEFREMKMLSSELSPEAVVLAEKNAKRILGVGPGGVSRLEILKVTDPLSVLESFGSQLQKNKSDFLISNPPYMILSDPIEKDVITHEPKMALFAPESDPLYFYRKIASQASQYLKTNGLIFLELPSERATAIRALFSENKYVAEIALDLNGRERVLIAKLS